MSLMPVFQIGVWNAWILIALLFLFMLMTGFLPAKIKERITPVKEIQKINGFIWIVFFIMILYSVFLPMKLGTAWFIAGLVVYIVGFLIAFAAFFSIAASKSGEPFTKGTYRYSRHPLVLSTMVSITGAAIASASWLFLLLAVILMVLSRAAMMIEEGVTLKKFGEPYKDYMNRTPRWFGLPKSGK